MRGIKEMESYTLNIVWTANQVKYLTENYKSKSIPEIAKALPHKETDVLRKLLSLFRYSDFRKK